MNRLFHVFSGLFFLFLFGCGEEEKVQLIEPYKGPMAEVKNVVTLFSDSAIVRIKLKAPVQYELQNQDREFPEGVNIEFFNTKGETETILTADYGKFFDKKQLYNAKGNVVIVNQRTGEQLNSEELYWNPANERIYTDKFVRVKTKNEILLGNGLEANQDFSEYKILEPTGIFTLEDEDEAN